MIDVESLKKLALLGAMHRPVKSSSNEFAEYLSTSPQTAARRLQALEKEALISRKIVPSGQWIIITKNGTRELQEEYLEYQNIFSREREERLLIGSVITGLGEGQYYTALDGYKTQFRERLGFEPFPGTLNIKLDNQSLEVRKKMVGGIKIKGFAAQNRTFGGGKCFNAKIQEIGGAVILPDRTHYPEDIIEVIAPVNLREHLSLRDGSEVQIELC